MIIAGWCVPLLCVSNGWRASLRIMGIFGVLSSICIFYLLRDRTIVSIKRIKLESLPLKEQSFWILSFIQFIRLGSYYTYIAWLPLVLKEEYGLSIVATSGSMSLLNIAGIISNPLGGIIADKVGEKKVLLYGFFFLMGSTLLFSRGYGYPVLLPLVFLIGWFINFTRSPSFSIVPELFGVRNAGSISGINNTFASLGALILPFLLGYVRDISNSYTIGWYSVATLSLLAVSLLYFIENPENV